MFGRITELLLLFFLILDIFQVNIYWSSNKLIDICVLDVICLIAFWKGRETHPIILKNFFLFNNDKYVCQPYIIVYHYINLATGNLMTIFSWRSKAHNEPITHGFPRLDWNNT